LLDLLACPMCKNFPLECIVLEEEVYENRELPGEPPLCELYCGLLRKELKKIEGQPPCQECIKKEIVTGVLYCRGCGRWYPIINTIPHMLPDYLREQEKKRELSFLEKYKDKLPDFIVFKGKPHNLSELGEKE